MSTTVLCLAAPVHAQETQNEGEAWLRAGLYKKWGKIRLGVSPEFRTSGLEPESYMARTTVRYRPVKYFDVQAGYRFQFKEKGDALEARHRAELSLTGRYSFGPITPSLRIRYTDALNSPDAPKRRLRYRGELAYELKKLDLELAGSVAPFHDLVEQNLLKMRYHLGVEYKFDKKKPLKQKLGLAYRLDYHLQEYLNVHIVLLSYSLSF